MNIRIKKYIVSIGFGLILSACSGGGDDPAPTPTPPTPNSAPSKAQLIYPSINLLCIDNTIAFNWNSATDSDGDAISYKLTVAKNRSLTDIVEERIVTTTGVTITLAKGIAYYWRIIATDSKNASGEPTAIQAFYTAGDGVSNYAPFTAELVSPLVGNSVNSGNITLSWKGADTNMSDTLTYELFFGESTDPTSVSSDLSVEMADVIVESGKTYYWKVNTSDNAGAMTIGQLWSFNVN